MRNTFSCVALIGLFLFSGCGKGDKESTGPSKKESAAGTPKVTPSAPETGTSETGTSETGTSETGTSGQIPNVSQEDMAGAGKEKAEDDAEKYPYEQLVSAAGNSRLTQAYTDSEDQLRLAPQDTDQQMQRAYVLYATGRQLIQKQDREQALLAFRAAFKNAEQLVKQNTDLPPDYHAPLADIYYNGACAESLDGKTDTAKAALRQAIEWGWADMEALANDPDLANVRALPGFDAEIASWREAALQALLQRDTFPLDFTVTTLAGAELKLSDLKGKVVIVDFWGTWCPPCREEIPSFIKLQETYAERGLQIIGLNYENVEEDEAKAKLAKDYAEANGINYPLALGTEEIMAQVPQFEGFPTTLFVDRTGKVRLKIVGLHEYAYLESLVVTLLDEGAAKPPVETPGTP